MRHMYNLTKQLDIYTPQTMRNMCKLIIYIYVNIHTYMFNCKLDIYTPNCKLNIYIGDIGVYMSNCKLNIYTSNNAKYVCNIYIYD